MEEAGRFMYRRVASDHKSLVNVVPFMSGKETRV